MTDDDILRMAIECQLVTTGNREGFYSEALMRFARMAMQHEREACAKVCKKLLKVFLSSQYTTGQPLSSFKERHAVASCVEAIRARGNT